MPVILAFSTVTASWWNDEAGSAVAALAAVGSSETEAVAAVGADTNEAEPWPPLGASDDDDEAIFVVTADVRSRLHAYLPAWGLLTPWRP